MVFVVWFFHWTVATSGGFSRPGDEDYYNFLVRGWRQGHLYMSKEPRPEMLALSDPYDPATNQEARLADASYFKGHYYLYFGAAPAFLLMLPYDIVTGQELGTTTAIYCLCVTGFLAASGLWLSVRGRYFPRSAVWAGALGILVLGLGTHVLALERRALVWELPISMAFACSMLALTGVYMALHGRRPVLSMGVAGILFGLAIAARPTCIFGSALFVYPIWLMWRQAGLRPQAARCAGSAAAGIGICLAAIFAHNLARFGDPLEFGQNYQLSGIYESRARHFSATYIPHNFYQYFLHPGNWTWRFPFVEVTPVTGGPAGYLGNWSEAIAGIAVTFPFIWFALFVPLVDSAGGRDWRLRAVVGAVLVYCLVNCLVILSYFVATERYMADFAPSLVMLALFGWAGLEASAARSAPARIATSVTALAACLATAAAGILVSFDYHGGMLHTLSPQKWDELRAFFARWGH
jgi:hypothetical protein